MKNIAEFTIKSTLSSAIFFAGLTIAAHPMLAATFTVYNTGVDNTGSILPDNSLDPHYSITSSPLGTASAYAVAPFFNWIPNSLTSKWISPVQNGGSTGVPNGNYTYKTTFDLTGFDPSTARLGGRFSVDDFVASVLLNGVNTGIVGGGFQNWTNFSISNGFVFGVNTLEFVNNNGFLLQAFRSEFTEAVANPIVKTTPENNSPLSLLALGTLGATLTLKRKLKSSKSTEKEPTKVG